MVIQKAPQLRGFLLTIAMNVLVCPRTIAFPLSGKCMLLFPCDLHLQLAE
jgi:hypothetical protein